MEMTLEDAANALVWWLQQQPIAFLSAISGKEIAPAHFRLGIAQVSPEQRQRIFEFVPLDIPLCWEVKELA